MAAACQTGIGGRAVIRIRDAGAVPYLLAAVYTGACLGLISRWLGDRSYCGGWWCSGMCGLDLFLFSFMPLVAISWTGEVLELWR